MTIRLRLYDCGGEPAPTHQQQLLSVGDLSGYGQVRASLHPAREVQVMVPTRHTDKSRRRQSREVLLKKKALMSGCGPTWTSRDVRFRAAIGDVADAKHA